MSLNLLSDKDKKDLQEFLTNLSEEHKQNLIYFKEHSDELKKVDLRTVDRSTLVQRSSVHIDPDASWIVRRLSFIAQIKNPYCYLDGKTVMKIQFADTGKTIEECLVDYLTGV